MMEPPPFSSIYFPAAISVKKIPFRLILINIDYFQPLFICHLFCRCIDADSRIIMAEIQASQFFYNFFYIYLLFVCAVCLDCNDFSASSFAVFFASSMSRSTIATSAPASANAVAVHFLLGDSDNLKEFFEKKSAGDTGCIERWEDYLRHLSILINNLHMVLEHTVILDGHVAPYFTDEDLSKIRHYVAEHSTFDDDTSYIIPGNHADIIFRIFRLFIIFRIFFRLPIDIFIFVRYYNINKRKGGRTTNQLNLYLKSKERGTVQCRGQSKLKRV